MNRRRLLILAAALACTAAAYVAVSLAYSAPAPQDGAPDARATPLHDAGHGDASTPAFTTGADWALTYTYTCPAGARMRVWQADPGRGLLPLLDASGRGAATVYQHQARGPHALRVVSGCAWTLTVVDDDGAS